MARRTDKYKKSGAPEVDLLPFMNLLSILIPALMISTEYIKIATIAVSSPRIGPSSASTQDEKPPEKPPLNLTVAISSLGFYVASSSNVIPGAEQGEAAAGEAAAAAGPTIPKVNVTVYSGTDSETGRQKEFLRVWTYKGNKFILGVQGIEGSALQEKISGIKANNPTLRQSEEMDHNLPALQEKLREIKKDWKDENRVIISSDPNINYTTLIRVMDATRSYKSEKGEKEFLFPQVVLSAGVV